MPDPVAFSKRKHGTFNNGAKRNCSQSNCVVLVHVTHPLVVVHIFFQGILFISKTLSGLFPSAQYTFIEQSNVLLEAPVIRCFVLKLRHGSLTNLVYLHSCSLNIPISLLTLSVVNNIHSSSIEEIQPINVYGSVTHNKLDGSLPTTLI